MANCALYFYILIGVRKNIFTLVLGREQGRSLGFNLGSHRTSPQPDVDLFSEHLSNIDLTENQRVDKTVQIESWKAYHQSLHTPQHSPLHEAANRITNPNHRRSHTPARHCR